MSNSALQRSPFIPEIKAATAYTHTKHYILFAPVSNNTRARDKTILFVTTTTTRTRRHCGVRYRSRSWRTMAACLHVPRVLRYSCRLTRGQKINICPPGCSWRIKANGAWGLLYLPYSCRGVSRWDVLAID